MQNYGIVFTAPNVASVLDLPMPSPKAGEVLVRLKRSALSSGTERDDALAFIRMLAHGRISCDDLVEETHAVAEAPEVFGRLARSADFPTVQFLWEGVLM